MIYPKIIQGGMGVAVSSWQLANAVGRLGQMGVISGTGIDTVLTRRLQCGDIGGHMRRALDHFPIREMAERIWDNYFVPGGKRPDVPFKSKPMPSIHPPKALLEMLVVANFVEVWLAKDGHNGPIGINLLTKIQVPTVPSLYGAMLANVDFVLMGAGIPRAIPAVLDKLSQFELTQLRIDVAGERTDEPYFTTFEPKDFAPAGISELKRPEFLAIVSSSALASTLARKATGKVNGFVIEGPTAGGHNAPPRGPMNLNDIGEPIYGDRDVPELEEFRKLGLPFWMAGSFGYHHRLQEALDNGAQGIQVGTPFAYCNESGMIPEIRQRVIEMSLGGNAKVFTDPLASPTGFPFKVVQASGTLSDPSAYQQRTRICDLGYLRTAYVREDGKLGYRCPSEPIEDFVDKGGEVAETAGRKCICNGLLGTIGLGQTRKDGSEELPIITSGDEVSNLATFVPEGETSYSAEHVVNKLLNG
jgi:nitronate monooxygenase